MATKAPLHGMICLVTGATRGIGKGVAVQLGEAGATVYITGRTVDPVPGKTIGGSLRETADEIVARGGQCTYVRCDHSDEKDIERVFQKIRDEQDGKLDLLVNNCYSGVQTIKDQFQTPFWESPPTLWDEINNVGLRAHYIATVYAARLMVPRKQGLIINISSGGGIRYLPGFSIPYGCGKQSLDRMSTDCAIELRKHNVACVTLWPGLVATEHIKESFQTGPGGKDKKDRVFSKADINTAETPEYAGIAVVHLAQDSNIMKRTGRILLTTDLASEFGFTDVTGNNPSSMRSVSTAVKYAGWVRLAKWIPQWVKLPLWLVHMSSNKF